MHGSVRLGQNGLQCDDQNYIPNSKDDIDSSFPPMEVRFFSFVLGLSGLITRWTIILGAPAT